MENVLISACLLGISCRYNGQGQLLDDVEDLMSQYHLVPVCPEVLGGLSTPREPAEIRDGKVVTKSGVDVTPEFVRGAHEVLKLNELYRCRCAILKERSPSCGYGFVYDGSFSGKLVEGNGILAELLSEKGVHILGEKQLKARKKLDYQI